MLGKEQVVASPPFRGISPRIRPRFFNQSSGIKLHVTSLFTARFFSYTYHLMLKIFSTRMIHGLFCIILIVFEVFTFFREILHIFSTYAFYLLFKDSKQVTKVILNITD